MPAFLDDHIAIRVASIERASGFYRSVFGSTALSEPFEMAGEFAQRMLGERPGASFRMQQLSFDRGVLELFELCGTPGRVGRAPASLLHVMHIGVQVDDVPAALELVVRNGGEVLVPETRWSEATLCFCADPDGTVLELADAPIRELIRQRLTRAAAARPGRADTRGPRSR